MLYQRPAGLYHDSISIDRANRGILFMECATNGVKFCNLENGYSSICGVTSTRATESLFLEECTEEEAKQMSYEYLVNKYPELFL